MCILLPLKTGCKTCKKNNQCLISSYIKVDAETKFQHLKTMPFHPTITTYAEKPQLNAAKPTFFKLKSKNFKSIANLLCETETGISKPLVLNLKLENSVDIWNFKGCRIKTLSKNIMSVLLREGQSFSKYTC